jgi:hypothetical protein
MNAGLAKPIPYIWFIPGAGSLFQIKCLLRRGLDRWVFATVGAMTTRPSAAIIGIYPIATHNPHRPNPAERALGGNSGSSPCSGATSRADIFSTAT